MKFYYGASIKLMVLSNSRTLTVLRDHHVGKVDNGEEKSTVCVEDEVHSKKGFLLTLSSVALINPIDLLML